MFAGSIMSAYLLTSLIAVGCDDNKAADNGSDHDDDHGAAGASDHDHDSAMVGPLTGATCPSGSTLTYDNFGAPFMAAYCTRCHDSALTGADRHGAPAYHDFDTFGGIIAVADHVDWWAGAGPAAENTLMPPDAPAPSLDERYQLSEWLACELENR